MRFTGDLVEIFLIALAATSAVAVLSRLSGSRPDKQRMFAIAIGLVVAQAIQLHWSLSTAICALIIGACVAVCVLVSFLFGRAKSEA